MVTDKQIKELTPEEFRELLEGFSHNNFISVNGVQVSSTTASLREVEKSVDRLIKKHSDFLLLKKKQDTIFGGVG